jgi:hypothetical protein
MKSLCSSKVVIFEQYIAKKHKWFGIKLYKLRDSIEYTHNMTMYLNVRGLAARIEHVEHKLYMDSFFSTPALFDNLHTKTINCGGIVRPSRTGMPKNF